MIAQQNAVYDSFGVIELCLTGPDAGPVLHSDTPCITHVYGDRLWAAL